MGFRVNRGRKIKSFRRKVELPSKPKPIWLHRIDATKAGALLGNQPISSTIGALGAGSIIASISYHVGYLLRIDSHLISFFSIQDVLSSTKAVVPIIALIGLFMFGFIISISKKKTSRSNEIPKIQQNIAIAATVIMSLVLVVFSFLEDFAIGVFALTMLLMGLLVIYLAKQERVRAASFYFCAMWLLMALFPFAIFGSNSAEADLLSDRRPHRITVGINTSDVLILLANSDVLIVRDDPRMVRVIPRRLVTEIKVLGVGKPLKNQTLKTLWRKLVPTLPNTFSSGR